MYYKHAITREPGVSFDRCISDHPLKKYLNIGIARKQHELYRKTLMELGLEVINLPRDDLHPDACFVEDTIVLDGKKGFITRMAMESRRGEDKAISDYLKNKVELTHAKEPATIEGGDVVHLENYFICGITQRTNELGVKQMETFFKVPVKTISLPDAIHLKSYISYLGKKTILVANKIVDNMLLREFNKIIVPKIENYAANALTINNTVLMAKNYPKTQQLVKDAGFEVIPIDNSEFEKCGGALTCLSILF